MVKTRENYQRNPTEEVAHNVTLATLALKDGNVDKSERKLLATLNVAENNKIYNGIISVCDMLSSLCMRAGDYEEAEDFLIRALDNLYRLGVPENDNFVVSFKLKLSRVYSSNGNDEMAEVTFKNCVQLQRMKLEESVDEETFLLWMTILYWYGKFLYNKNRFEEAKSCFQDCYITSSKIQGILLNQVMVILYNLGEVCQVLGEHDQASTNFLRAISLDKQQRNPDLAYFYIKLGKITLWKQLYRDASFWCDQGKKLACKHRNCEAEKESSECLQAIQNVFLT